MGKHNIPQKMMNKVKFFHKHIVEGKSVSQCSEELGLSRVQLHSYKKADDFRQMAIEHLENSKLKGLAGTISLLVKTLDVTKPVIVKDVVVEKGCRTETSRIEYVPDEKLRLEALKEIKKIYGVDAPKRNTTVTVSLSSDDDLYKQIDEAQRACRFVESYVKGEKGSGMAEGEQGGYIGDFEKRQRAVLQDVAVQES